MLCRYYIVQDSCVRRAFMLTCRIRFVMFSVESRSDITSYNLPTCNTYTYIFGNFKLVYPKVGVQTKIESDPPSFCMILVTRQQFLITTSAIRH